MDVLKGGGKAFGWGFCGCIGAWVASILLIIPLVLIGRMATPALGDLGKEVMDGLREEVSDILGPSIFKMVKPESPSEGGQPEATPEGGEPGGPPAGGPTCEGLSPDTVNIWLTKENDPEAERFTVFTANDDAFAWVQGPEGCEGQFALQLNVEGGPVVPLGSTYSFDPGGTPVACGSLNEMGEPGGEPPPVPFRLEVVSGGEVVAGIDARVEVVE
jgi:hypothetical protein